MKVKIVYLISSLRKCGPTNVLYNLSKNIDKNKYDITVVSLKKTTQNNMECLFQKQGIKCICLNVSTMNTFFVGEDRLRKMLVQIKPDIVHAHCLRSTLLLSVIKNNVIKIATLHCYPHVDYMYAHGRIIGTIMFWLHLHALEKMDNVVACSRAISEEMKEKFDIKSNVVVNGVDYEITSNPTSITKHREQYILVCIGNFNKRKNQRLILDKFRELLAENKVKIMFLGDGECINECKRYNVPNVFYLGNVDNVSDYLVEADGLISASKAEGMPMAILEALMSGVPRYILSDIGPHREIASYFPNDVKIINFNNITHQKLEELYCFIKKPRKREEIINEAKEKISAEIMAENYMKIYSNFV